MGFSLSSGSDLSICALLLLPSISFSCSAAPAQLPPECAGSNPHSVLLRVPNPPVSCLFPPPILLPPVCSSSLSFACACSPRQAPSVSRVNGKLNEAQASHPPPLALHPQTPTPHPSTTSSFPSKQQQTTSSPLLYPNFPSSPPLPALFSPALLLFAERRSQGGKARPPSCSSCCKA